MFTVSLLLGGLIFSDTISDITDTVKICMRWIYTEIWKFLSSADITQTVRSSELATKQPYTAEVIKWNIYFRVQPIFS
jgi:hypothetical protein